MSSEVNVQIHDIVGLNGRYQILASISSFSIAGTVGILGIFVQFLCPSVMLYWNQEDNLSNKTYFKSTQCRLEDLFGANPYPNVSQNSSFLVYETYHFKRTLTEDLELVCERSWVMSFTNSIMMIGGFFGFILFGRLAEKYGRRPVNMVLVSTAFVSNICILLQQNLAVFIIACFAYGLTSLPSYNISFVPVLEIIPTSRRPIYGALANYGVLFGQSVFTLAAWILGDWFYIQLVHAVLVGLTLPLIWYLVESPLWLAIKGREVEAKRNMTVILLRNGRDPKDYESQIDSWCQTIKNSSNIKRASEEGKISDLFKNSVISKYTVFLSTFAFSLFFVYYGLLMNAEIFGSGLFLDMAFSNGLSFVSMIIASYLLTRFSIRMLTITSMSMLGVVCALYPILYAFPVARTVLFSLSRMFISPAFSTSFVYIAEVYPTSVRIIGSGFTNMVARIASALSPYNKELGLKTQGYVPFILFAALSVASAVLLRLLPETKGKALVHTTEELKRQEKQKKVSSETTE